MFLKGLYVEKLGRIKNQVIEFDTPKRNEEYFNKLKMSILVGENGTSKTSFLTFLADIFYYPNVRKSSPGYNSTFELKYEYEGGTYYTSNHFRADFLPEKIIVSSNSLYDKFPHRRNRMRNGYSPEYVYAGKRLIEESAIIETYRKKDKKFKLLLNTIGYSSAARLLIDMKMLESLMTNNSTTKKFIKDIDIIFSIADYRNDLEDGRRLILNLDEISNLKIEVIIRLLTSFFKRAITLQFAKHGEWISLENMSSGERAMFSRFCPLINSMSHHSIVLIDEPETNLHPVWIQKYVFILNELFSEYESHIILATHSPLIAADVPRECIVGLVENPNDPTGVIQYKPDQSTLGGDPASILRKVFKINNLQGKFTLKTHERIIELLEEGYITEALELFNDLSATIDKFELYDEMVKKRPEELS